MLIDFKKLFQTCKAPEEFTFSADLSQKDFQSYTVAKPAEVTLLVTPQLNGLAVTGNIHVSVQAQCARCLTDIERSYDFPVEEMVRIGENFLEDAELPIQENGRLDIDELAYTETVLGVPSVLLCSEDCLGLCPICGKPRAEGCTCQAEEPVDERLAILKKLLS